MSSCLVTPTPRGLYCEQGDFYVDPSRGVPRAVVTHAHSDHARRGSEHYLCARPGVQLLRRRLGPRAVIRAVAYGEPVDINGVRVSLHPAGHVLGSAQVRLEHAGRVTVVSGDYKLDADPTCAAFEPVRCDTFITEATFGVPLYRWPSPAQVFGEINAWWRSNQQRQRTSVIYAYALGKAQRILAGVDANLGPIFVDRTIAELLPAYTAESVKLPDVRVVEPYAVRAARGHALVLTPMNGAIRRMRRWGEAASAFASGWVHWRGGAALGGGSGGFVLSDHADWPGLTSAIRATGASDVGVMHGFTGPLTRWLRAGGWNAWEIPIGPHGRLGVEPSEEAVAQHSADVPDSTADACTGGLFESLPAGPARVAV